MEWLENIPAPARLALSVGGAAVAALVNWLPPAFQAIALGAGISLCCYGIAASLRPLLIRRDAEWLASERRKDFVRQQHLLNDTFRNVKTTRLAAGAP